MTIIRLGDKFANLYTPKKIHVETLTVVGFKHDWLTVYAACKVEYASGEKAKGIIYYSVGLIGQELRNGYMKRLN